MQTETSLRLTLALALLAAACGDSAAKGSGDRDAAADAPASDATQDASEDAPGADAEAPPAPKNALFAHIDGTLVRVDPADGSLTTVGETGHPFISIVWDTDDEVARVVIGKYSPTGAGATLTPKLGTINLCTAAVTEGPAITINGDQVRRAEGFTRDPSTGTFWIAVGTTGTGVSTEYVTEKNGTVDPSTGAVTVVGSHQTLQDDGDGLVFVGATLYLHDIATTTSQGRLYTLNQTTGAATLASDVGDQVLRLAYDPTREVLFAAMGDGDEPTVSARGLATLDPESGEHTDIGDALEDTDFAGAHFTALASVPAPDCK